MFSCSPADWNVWVSILKGRLGERRFDHSLSVAKTASVLAKQYDYNICLAEVSGLLHDYARDLREEELLGIAEKRGLIRHPVERQVPVLLHGPVGGVLVKEDLGICDEEVLQAIACHTTGAPGMSGLSGIIYLADMIEPLRDFPGVDKLRSLARRSLKAAVIAALESSIRYCLDSRLLIHPLSIEARNYLLTRDSI